MSLEIDSRRICAVHALGEWHPVKLNSFDIDAYELVNHERGLRFGHEDHDFRDDSDGYVFHRIPSTDVYALGAIYPKIDSKGFKSGDRTYYIPISGHCGATWLHPDTDVRTCVSLLEIKAWRQATEKEATEANPYLDRETGNELMYRWREQEQRRREKEEEAREAMAEQAAAT